MGGGVNFTDTMSTEDGQNPELQPCAQVTRHRRSRTSWQGASRPGRPCGPRSVTACTAGGRPRVSPAQGGVAGRPRGGTRPAVPAAAGCALVWPCHAAPTAGGRLGHVQVGTALRCRREHPRTLLGARVCAPRLGVEGVGGEGWREKAYWAVGEVRAGRPGASGEPGGGVGRATRAAGGTAVAPLPYPSSQRRVSCKV